jgi:dTMP kinase
VGRHIRALVLDPANAGLDRRAEALLLAADRAQHVSEVVEPALGGGRHVVSDRFSGSTLAYQGFGQGLDHDELRWLSGWASGGLEPDLIVLLDVDAAVSGGRQEGQVLDRLETQRDAFHQRVRAGYRALAAADPARWVVVDGSVPEDEVAARVWEAVSARLEPATRPTGRVAGPPEGPETDQFDEGASP